MNGDFLTFLPSEIINNIFLRLPIETIATSKCVSKPWLHLLESNEFVKSYSAKSVPALAVLTFEGNSSSCTIFKFEDGRDLESHNLHYHQLTKFDFPVSVEIKGSANGFLFLHKQQYNDESEAHYVCNPITRDYIELHFPKELIRPYPKHFNYPEILQDSAWSYPPSITYGFGASKISKQYKVVRISHSSVIVHKAQSPRRIIPDYDCHVFTLGTESWRRVELEPGALFEYASRSSCVFHNGCLHWIVSDSYEKQWISCFDLETESFSYFSTPPLVIEAFDSVGGLSTLEDCLCFCDHTGEDETAIWLMKEYEVEKSWTKEYAFNIFDDLDIEGFELVYPLKVFQDGDILMLQGDYRLFYYSSNTATAQEIGIFSGYPTNMSSILFTPSLLSLKCLGMKNVISF